MDFNLALAGRSWQRRHLPSAFFRKDNHFGS
jgi:hypothetical protein